MEMYNTNVNLGLKTNSRGLEGKNLRNFGVVSTLGDCCNLGDERA